MKLNSKAIVSLRSVRFPSNQIAEDKCKHCLSLQKIWPRNTFCVPKCEWSLCTCECCHVCM